LDAQVPLLRQTLPEAQQIAVGAFPWQQIPVHAAPLPQTQVLLLPQVLPLVQSVSAQHSLQVPLQQCWPEAQQAATDVPLQ